MITDHALGLPSGEHAKRPQFGDDALDCTIDTIPANADGLPDRKAEKMVLANVE